MSSDHKNINADGTSLTPLSSQPSQPLQPSSASAPDKNNKNNKNDKNNNNRVPISVLDRFLKMSQDNNQAYLSIISVLDSLSANLEDLSDHIEKLENAIEDEELTRIVQESSRTIKDSTASIKEVMDGWAKPEYNILSAMATYMEYHRVDVQAISESFVWIAKIADFIRRNRMKIAFLAGVFLVFVIGTSGLSLWDLIKTALALK